MGTERLFILLILVLTRSSAHSQHHLRISYCMVLAQEKIKIQSMLSTEGIWLSHHHKVNKRKSNHP